MRSKIVRTALCLGALAAFTAALAPTANAQTALRVHRLGGTDNIGVSVEVSRFYLSQSPDGALETVVLARHDLFADSLASAHLQDRDGARLLLTTSDRLDPRVAEELTRTNTRIVHILGGPQAISPAIEQELRSRGMEVTRYAGADRVDTATLIAEASRAVNQIHAPVVRAFDDGPGSDPTRAFIDSLAAGMAVTYYGEPVLLSEKGRLSPRTSQYLEGAAYDSGLVVGGPAALSSQVDADLARVVAGGVRRVSGEDRYATAVALSRDSHRFESEGAYDPHRIVLADGIRPDSWAPGFTAPVLSRVHPASSTTLVLSAGNALPEVTRQYLAREGRTAEELVCTAYVTQAACDEAARIMLG